MNRLYLTALASFVMASSAFATSTTCPTGALTLYLASPTFSCTTNLLTFTFDGPSSYISSGTNLLPASSITVSPILTQGDEGFTFSAPWNLNGANLSMDSLIQFTASGPSIDDLELFFNGGYTGTGLTNVVENYCLNGPLVGCPNGSSGQIKVTNPPQGFNDQVFFSSATSVSVSKDIELSTGNSTGTAFISQVANNFSASQENGFSTPEPLSFVLLGSGLLGLGLLRKRIKH